MNKTERLYGDYLEIQKRAGQIFDWRYEPIKLKLARATFYTPDFLVIRAGKDTGGLFYEFHEVKGFWRDDARVKIKVAAALFPWFQFLAVRLDHGRWLFETIEH